MRLPTRKVWRAFPELDAFTDEECRAYLQQILRTHPARSTAVTVVAVLIALVVGGTIYAACITTLQTLGVDFEEHATPVFAVLISFVVMITVSFGVPFVGVLVARDAWLRRSLRKRISLAGCGGCGYSLLGLAVATDAESEGEFITCPECARRTWLRELGVTREAFMARKTDQSAARATP